MRDSHIIRVIIQGYDRLSNVMKDAANKAAPSLDKLREKTRNYRRETDETGKSIASTANAVDNLNDGLDKQASKLERLGRTWGNFRRTISQKIRGPEEPTPESPAEMFDRLKREGRQPQTPAPLQGFQSRADFVKEETARRAEIERTTQAIKDQGGAVDDLAGKEKRRFDGLVPFDDFLRGLQRGRAFRESDEGTDTVSEQRLKNQRALAEFDRLQSEEEEKLRNRRDKERKDTEEDLRGRESARRASLNRLERMNDEFANKEKLRLRTFKITRDAELKEEIDADQRLLASRSKKIPQQERDDARDRVTKARLVAAQEVSAEEAATERIITQRQRRYETVHSGRLRQIRDETREEINGVEKAHKSRLGAFRDESVTQRRILIDNQRASLADLPSLVRGRSARRDEQLGGLGTRAEVFGAKATLGVKDFIRGMKGARSALGEFEGAALKAQTTAAQTGAAFGKATQNLNSFVSVRWGLLISLVGVFGTVVTQLAAALVAVASSAAMAAAALGGAFLAGLGQAIPVIGLLAAAFHQLGNAMDVINLREQARNRSAVDEKAQADARRSAAQQLADANYALKQSIEGVTDAQKGLRDAHESVTLAEKEQKDAATNLADARVEAARAIVDASLAEKEARLSLREAELGVLDAKERLAEFERQQRLNKSDLTDAQAAVREAQERLRIAQQEGDALEISGATAALADARQNVTGVQDQIANTANQQKELELGVKRAQINEKQAQLRQQRAIEENRRRRSQGIEGSPEVKAAVDRITAANRSYRDALDGVTAAQRRLRDAEHQVVISHRNIADAQRAVTDASDKMSQAQRNAQREFDKLSPSEKRFVLAMERFKRRVKENLNPITGIIIDAFSRGLDRAGTLLQDPEIKDALRTLANEIADVGDRFTEWAISPEGRRAILFFIHEAARNLPIIADAAGKFGRVLVRLAIAAGPVFRDIVDGLDTIAGKADDATENSGKLTKFFESAGEHLEGWVRLAGAIGNLLGALIGAAAGEGLNMVKGITGAFNDLAERINKNPKPIRDFFISVREGLADLLPALGRFFLVLLKVFTSDNMRDFTKFILLTVIPAILHVITTIGFIVGVIGDVVHAIDDFLGVPIVGTLGGWIIQIGLFMGIMKVLFPVLSVFGPVLTALVGAIFGIIEAFAAAIIAMNPIVLAIIALIAIIVLLDRKFHFLRPTIEAVWKALKFVFEWVKDHWKLLLGILLGPFTLLLLAATKWRGKIIGFFKDVIDWVRDHWKILLVILTGPFSLVLLAVIKWKDKIIGFAKAIIEWFRDNWKKIVGIVLAIFRPGGLILAGILRFKNTVLGIFRDIKDGIINAFKKAFDWVKDKFLGLGGFLKDKASKLPVVGRFFKDDNEETDAGLNPSAVLNKIRNPRAQNVIKRLRAANVPDENILAALIKLPEYRKEINKIQANMQFQAGGQVPGAQGSPVPIVAHAGEWVLNKAQQMKVARRIGQSAEAVKNWLFGSKMPEGQRPGPTTTGTRPTTKANPYQGPNFSLHPHEDPDGNVVWFIEMGDRSWAQISGRDASHIMKSKGEWIPQYIRQNRRGIFQQGRAVFAQGVNKRQQFALGGVVQSRQFFDQGGVVMNSGTGPRTKIGVGEQNFNVTVKGDTDWHHVMRIGALHAQESF